MNALGYDEILTLFRRHVFVSLDPKIYSAISSETVEESISLAIGTLMEKFEGNPLLTKLLSGYLGDNLLSKHLDEINKLVRHNEYNADCLMKLCYYGLPAHIQACFRYYSMFPREHKFNKEDLMKLWMGKDLFLKTQIPTKGQRTLGRHILIH